MNKKEYNKVYLKSWKLKNPNYQKEYFKKNKESLKIKKNKWRRKNAKLFYSKRKKYLKTNPWIKILDNIKQRCSNPNNKIFKNYGGRGIKCLMGINEIKIIWDRDKAIKMNQPSIDRIDNDGHYVFENCRFIEFDDNRKRGKTYLSK